MGCVSSKLFKKEFERDSATAREIGSRNHVVSLTSTTYGALNLDVDIVEPVMAEPTKKRLMSPPRLSAEKIVEELEIINAWELMKDLEEGDDGEVGSFASPPKKRRSPNRGQVPKLEIEKRCVVDSPKKPRRFLGTKENKINWKRFEPSPSPKQVLKPLNSVRTAPALSLKSVTTPKDLKSKSFRMGSRRSLSPMFDPELIETIERELKEEKENIKKGVSPRPRSLRSQESDSMLKLFEKRCPPGGENAVVIYTTTLRGIRKTFEDCNAVRSIVESYHIQVVERDVSMHSGFREELRGLMGKKDARVPLVFVKGRLIGGADEVVKMEEEGQLGMILRGIPTAMGGCAGCGGMRFVVCIGCNGSCKVMDEVQRKMVRCGECNENGLIQCPLCCLQTL
ncbi:hypothetical protein Sjap_001143 [Stephania japonica]|uniref:Glutaredoxin domain-containing protein n=1 Tax=Stephania japonica TaxID=461633 RepID=A0AAP0KKY2_9MAGN